MWFIKFLGVLTILATLALGAVVYLQYDEIAGFKAEPSAWPAGGVPKAPNA